LVPLRPPAPEGRETAPSQTAVDAVSTERVAETRMPVVILSGGVTGLGVLRGFSRQNIPCYVHATAISDPIRQSRWYRALPGADDLGPPPQPSVAALEQTLEQSKLSRAFLCACGDDWNRVVAAFAERGSGRFVSMAPPVVALEILQNKANLAMLLQALGVPMPSTLPIDGEGKLAALPPSDGSFYFLKPIDSQTFLARFGRKGIRVSTVEEARQWLDVLHAAGVSVVLQEYIPGSADEHFFIDGYADHGGVVKALFARRRQRMYPLDFGYSTAMVSVPLSAVEAAVDCVLRVLAAADYRGIFSVEFKRDRRDGLFRLLEINARPWWFVDFATRCGVDVCRMAYDDARGVEVHGVRSYRLGKTCVFPYYDFFAMQRQVATGSSSWWRWIVEVAAAYQPVGCFDDPRPALVSTARILGKALRNRLPG
jgi:predicted ATP-grasp superfamily ATP-dependent carboligase